MASITTTSKYYKIVFTDTKKSPTQKAIYQPKNLSKRHARKLKQKLEKLYERGEYNPWKDDYKDILRGEQTEKKVKEVIQEYIDRQSKKEWSASTAKNTEYMFNKFMREQNIKHDWIDDLTIKVFNTFINRKADLSPKTREYYIRNFKTFIKYLNEKNYNSLSEDELYIDKKYDNYEKQKKYFEPHEIRKICSKIEEKVESDIKNGYQTQSRNSYWLIDFIWWQVLSGMRLNETLSIRIKDLDLDRGIVQIRNQKGQREEMFKFKSNDKLVEIAKKYKEKSTSKKGRLFQHKDGSRASKNFKKYLKLALPEKSDYNQHCLRHTCCVWLVRSNMNVFKIKDYMRHKEIETTLEYAKLVDEDYFDEAGEHLNKYV